MTNADPLSYIPNSRAASLFVYPATIGEVVDSIACLPNKGGNVDSIPMTVYKNISNIIASNIVDIFNSSVSEGVFPDVLKVARVVPILKSGNSRIVGNYRLISILHTLSKIIEKIMKSRVSSYLKKEDIMSKEQYDFRSGLSTSDAILEFTDRCTVNSDNKLFTIAVYLDLSKAFDTVDRNIMVSKLERMGIRGVVRDWFESYLTDRRMFVSTGGVNSDMKTVNIGLPQGTVFSPYLFSLYVNDMNKSSSKLNFVHFADDTNVFMSGNNLQNLCEEVSVELDKVWQWLKCNKLSLNISKTSFMLFTHSNVSMIPVNVSIGGNFIERTECINF